MATIDISCKGCISDYWEIIAPAVPVEYSELMTIEKRTSQNLHPFVKVL
ncbi:hypothetical protein E2C01_093096 [Portunus trituberculatus]|uniref:Uncharacterized protein n=1 Tax=Portunus trituberculatus TaxID=210409 RepID=A0A5B7JT48_PORTR|nr:hypothetical protein [Portunus trituberculatus]